ncbi:MULTISPECIES: AbrB/MazE/SpoVT family DNA-binding domain-containing protein [unclassified Halorubrum]|uniref:AbrB/MazE/SpoVT family DNA-binding domain-containing protein n=1 Tax=unclassified Halorubrum TaxID=2642239 RepID=UPI0010F60A32|nr:MULTISPECIES: AbrB/MazE/SpoVT family DNA-binding domain-containing protein [unclassified Halorubrum]TKX45260.1 phosphate uptake regulator PhoU [Halorubrum sp. ARQ200]TKX51566.1 phosphate uptake regulator PhoU [Halorubrum sp. ASP121]
METRKVQTVGNGTYTVSLPKEWAESQGVTAGDTVSLHDHIDGVLAVQTPEGCDADAPAAGRIESAEPEVIARALRAAYAAGLREVTIECDGALTPAQRRVVERTARGRIGMSVAAESETETTVRIMLDSEEVSVSQSLRQLSFTARSIHADAVESLEAAPDESPVGSRDDQVERLAAMIERSVSRGAADLSEVDALGATRPELFESWTAMRELRRFGDAASEIGAAAAALDEPPEGPPLEAFREVGRTVRDVVVDGVGVTLGDDPVAAARDAVVAAREARERIDSFDRWLDEAGPSAAELRWASRALRRTAERAGDVAEVGLRRAVRSGEPVRDAE